MRRRAIEHNEDAEMAAIRARQLYLEAGQPINAAEQQMAMFSVALRRGEPTENVRAYMDQAFDGDRRPAALAGTRGAASPG